MELPICKDKYRSGNQNFGDQFSSYTSAFFAHSLNLCLQDIGRRIVCVRDALELVCKISKQIKFSPKRLHLFSAKLQEADGDTVSLKSICLTTWIARTGAIDAILKDYSLLLEVLDEIYHTTKDDYGLKAYGLLQIMEKLHFAFGLMLSYQLFSASEQVSLTLQKKEYQHS